MSSEVTWTPATMPSTTATNARPWDSPAVVHRNTRPIFPRRPLTSDLRVFNGRNLALTVRPCGRKHDCCTLLIMDYRSALTLSIGVLGGLAVAVTAEVITVPIWVVIASACTPTT